MQLTKHSTLYILQQNSFQISMLILLYAYSKHYENKSNNYIDYIPAQSNRLYFRLLLQRRLYFCNGHITIHAKLIKTFRNSLLATIPNLLCIHSEVFLRLNVRVRSSTVFEYLENNIEML